MTGLQSCIHPPTIPYIPPAAFVLPATDSIESAIAAENVYAEKISGSFREYSEKYIRQAGAFASVDELPDLPVSFGTFSFSLRKDAGTPFSRLYRTDSSGEKMVLDLDLLYTLFGSTDLTLFRPSPSGTRAAFILRKSKIGDNLLVFCNMTGKNDCKPGPAAVHSAEWGQNESELYALKYGNLLAARLVLINPGKDDETTIFEEQDPSRALSVTKTRSQNFMVLRSSSIENDRPYLIDLRDPAKDPLPLFQDKTPARYRIDEYNGDFFILTDLEAVNFRLLTARRESLNAPSVLIPEDTGLVLLDLVIFKDRLALNTRSGVNERVLLFNPKKRRGKFFEGDDKIFSTRLISNPDVNSQSIYYIYRTPHRPAAVYKYHLADEKRGLIFQAKAGPESGFKAENYTAVLLQAKSRDGTNVPLTLVSEKDIPGPRPVILFGYGAYGNALQPWLTSERAQLLKNGFSLAFAHVRGGGEFGAHWHNQGRLKHKRNSFADFTACAEKLIHTGVTSPSLLTAYGRSAGGLLVAASAARRPDLFKTIILEAPFLDVAGQMQDMSLGLTPRELAEWGDPRSPEMLKYIRSYSPADAAPPRAMPNVLVISGIKDELISVTEPLRWIRKLRGTAENKKLSVLRLSPTADHSGENESYMEIREQGYKWGFARWTTSFPEQAS